MFPFFLFGVTQLSDPSDLPKNAFSIFLLLVDHLCVEHIDYALEIGLSGTSNSAHCNHNLYLLCVNLTYRLEDKSTLTHTELILIPHCSL